MKKIEKTYHLLRDLMTNAFHVECHFGEKEQDFNSEKSDHGLREMMWEDYHTNTTPNTWITEYLLKNCMLIIRSNLGFYNILITIISDKPGYILIGPFRAEEASALYFERIIRESGVPQQRILDEQALFRNLPVASLSNVVATAKRTIEEFYPEFKQIPVIEKKFFHEKHEPNMNKKDNQYLIQYWESYKEQLTNYLHFVRSGELTQARKHLKEFLDLCMFDSSNSLEALRRITVLLNDYSALALFSTNVHPYHIFQLHSQISDQIVKTKDNVATSYIVYDICHKYNLLIHNYNYENYSKIVRDIINYIDLHIEEPLSLELFATMLKRNPSTLSAQFHKETGTTLVSYIKQMRIQRAILLLNTTSKTISEISMEVGYDDFTYFSRIFKQVTGISPREYRAHTKEKK